MASTSYSSSASDARRNRFAQSGFEPPSFSLGIDPLIDPPSFSLRIEADPVPSTPCLHTNLNPNSEGKNQKPSQQRSIDLDSDEDGGRDFFPSRSEQGRQFKRLKRGPQSASTGLSDRLRLKRLLESRSTKNLSRCDFSLAKGPLPFVGGVRNQEPEGVHVSNEKSIGVRLDGSGTGIGGGAVPSGSDQEIAFNRLNSGASVISGQAVKVSRDFFCHKDVPKSREEETAMNGLSRGSTKQPLSFGDNFRNHAPDSGDVDDIEEFSEDELFGFGSKSQRDQRSSAPKKVGTDPILINSSPEDSRRPSLHVPGSVLQQSIPKVRLKASQAATGEIPASDDDTFLLDDFQSGSVCWRSTRPYLDRSDRTSQQIRSDIFGSQRTDSLLNQSKTCDVNVASTSKSFDTETPLRRDTVGPSQAFRNADCHETEENLILAFLRLRFPHYKPVDALMEDGGLDNEPVYIDYRKQFVDGKGRTQPQSGYVGAGRRWSPVRSIRGAFTATQPSTITSQKRSAGKKKVAPKDQPRKRKRGNSSASASVRARSGKPVPGGSGEGKWRTVNGSRVYIVGGQSLSGRMAYATYHKGRGNSSKKNKKRPKPKSK